MALEIRPAREADFERLLLLAAMMVSESPRYSRHAFSIDKARNLFAVLMQRGGLFCAVKDGAIIGFFAGIVAEHFLSPDLVASDIGIFITPDERGGSAFVRLVKAFEEWAVSQGAREISLGVSTQVHTEQTVRMYERLGYTMASFGLVKAGV